MKITLHEVDRIIKILGGMGSGNFVENPNTYYVKGTNVEAPVFVLKDEG